MKTGQQNGKLAAADVTPEMIADWKKKYGAVWKYEAEDGKTAFFRAADRKIAGLASTAPDPVAGNEILARNCFLAGDECIVEEDKYFFGLSRELPKYLKATVGKSQEL
jgi:hypothetical protein